MKNSCQQDHLVEELQWTSRCTSRPTATLGPTVQTGGIAKTQWTVPKIGNVLFSFVGPALLSSLSYSEHPFYLHTVVQLVLSELKLWTLRAWRHSKCDGHNPENICWFCFYHMRWDLISRGPCQPQLFCDSAQENWEEESCILSSWVRGAVFISEATSAGSCFDMPVSIALSEGTAGL